MLVQDFSDAVEFASAKAVVPAQTHRTDRTIQIEDGETLGTDDVNVCRPMVVRVNDYAQVPNSQDGWHRRRITYS